MAKVIIVGAGLGGLATAIAASDHGHDVTVLEKSELVGGAASFSGGQVWIAANHVQAANQIADSLEEGRAYVRHLGRAHPELIDDRALDRWLEDAPRAARYFEDAGAVTWRIIPDYPDYYQDAPGAKLTGRYLTAVSDGAELGDWRQRLRVSPHFPVGSTYDEILSSGLRASAFGASSPAETVKPDDALTFGTGVVSGFLAAAVRRDVDIRTQHEVTAPILDEDGCVTGVEVRTPAGVTRRFEGAVVIATSGYDWDDELATRFLGLRPEERGSVAPTSLTGDGLRLAERAGGGIITMPANRVPIQLGYPTDHEPGYAVAREHSLPHTFIVDRSGRRFADDAVYWEIVKLALQPDSPHRPCFMIFDSQHHRKFGLGTTPPGGDYPPAVVHRADTLAELGARLGIDGDELEATARRFNDHVAAGHDPDFGRGSNLTWQRFQGDPNQHPNPNLGTVDEPPYFGLKLTMVTTGIGLTGIAVDPVGRVLTADQDVVPGLYAVGAAAAFTPTGTAYNSGFSLSRGITLGLTVAESIETDAAQRA